MTTFEDTMKAALVKDDSIRVVDGEAYVSVRTIAALQLAWSLKGLQFVMAGNAHAAETVAELTEQVNGLIAATLAVAKDIDPSFEITPPK